MKEIKWELIRMDERSPHMHQAIEQVLTKNVNQGKRPPTIRFWEDPKENVMLGRFQAVKNELYEKQVRNDNIIISRRITGGGTMYTQPRTQITYSLYLPKDYLESDSIQASYKELDKFAINALKDLGYNVSYKLINDIISPNGKVGGSAQTRQGNTVLHHTRIAYEMQPEKMVKYLKIGEEKIKDKAIKSAEKSVNPLKKQNPEFSRMDVIKSLINKFSEDKEIKDGKITRDEEKRAKELVHQKFSTKDWIYKFK